MKRVAIIGCGGAGKSTLARELAERLGIEATHMDELFWRPGWVEPPREEWAALNRRLVRREAWIMDGNYGSTMDIRLAAADTVVFLDTPTALCAWRVTRRQLRGAVTRRSHLGPGLPDRIDHDFLRFLDYVLGYRRTRRPAILERLRRHPGEVHVLRTRREARELVRRAAHLSTRASVADTSSG